VRHRIPAAILAATAAMFLLAGSAFATDCQPPPPIVFHPAAAIFGPCGDPMYRARFTGTDVPAVFHWRFTSYATGETVLLRRTVAAGDTLTTPYRHVLGGTRMTIKARPVGSRPGTGVLLVTERSAPGGEYRPCR